MNILMMIYDEEIREEVLMLIRIAEIHHYNQFIGLRGADGLGKKDNSVAWPGTNEMLLIFLSQKEVERLKEIVSDYKKNKSGRQSIQLVYWASSEVLL